MIPNRLFIRNRANLAAQLPPKSIAVFTANEPMPRNGDEFYPFRQQSDFFYLTGINEENAFLLIAPDYPDESLREVLFIEPYDEVKATWQGEMLDARQASEISGVKTVKETIKWVEEQFSDDAEFRMDYYAIVDGNTLQDVKDWNDSSFVVGCIAIYLGKIRLIDNIQYKK